MLAAVMEILPLAATTMVTVAPPMNRTLALRRLVMFAAVVSWMAPALSKGLGV